MWPGRVGKFFWYLLVIYLTLDLMSFYGIMGVYITPDLRFASTLSGFFYGLWCGTTPLHQPGIIVSCMDLC